MITLEQERKRQESILRRLNPTLLKDRYKGVSRIEGEVKKYYSSEESGEDRFDISMDMPCDSAIIYCDNTQCTCGCIDLNDVIRSMVSQGKTRMEGIELCTGRDGFAYSYQCRTRVEYKITITYE